MDSLKKKIALETRTPTSNSNTICEALQALYPQIITKIRFQRFQGSRCNIF